MSKVHRKPVEPKNASTVILLREAEKAAESSFEILMVRRHAKSRFCSEFHVFPGGILDAADSSTEIESLCAGLACKTAGLLMPDLPAREALGSWAAAIRETFEEVGLLLAVDSAGSLVSFGLPEDRARFRRYRADLIKGRLSLRAMLEAEGLRLATNRLFYFSHWITPEALPLRYNVRFFVARAPQCQEALHDGYELTDHVWVTPQGGLRQYHQGKMALVLPTIHTLIELSSFKTIDQVIESTKGKTIPPILTRMEYRGDDYVEILPDGSVFGPSPL